MLRGPGPREAPAEDGAGPMEAVATKEGPAEQAARELWRVARKFMPPMRFREDGEERSLPQEMRRAASQALMRPNSLLRDLAGSAVRPRGAKPLLEDVAGKRLKRHCSEVRLGDAQKRSSSEAQLLDMARGPRRDSCDLLGQAPVCQSKESDRACLVPPLCSGAQLEADNGFFSWANQLVCEVAHDASVANFSVARVPGPPPLPPSTLVDCIRPPCGAPPGHSPSPERGPLVPPAPPLLAVCR